MYFNRLQEAGSQTENRAFGSVTSRKNKTENQDPNEGSRFEKIGSIRSLRYICRQNNTTCRSVARTNPELPQPQANLNSWPKNSSSKTSHHIIQEYLLQTRSTLVLQCLELDVWRVQTYPSLGTPGIGKGTMTPVACFALGAVFIHRTFNITL